MKPQTAVSSTVVTDQFTVLPAYTPEELQRIADSYVGRIFGIPDEAKEDAASAFVLAALEAQKRAKPGPGIRTYQHQAGRWAAGMFARDWIENRKHTPVSLEFIATIPATPYRDNDDDEVVEATLDADCTEETPLDLLITAEDARRVKESMALLPELSRRIVEMHAVDGWNFTRIGRETGQPRSRIWRLYTEAVKFLRKRIDHV